MITQTKRAKQHILNNPRVKNKDFEIEFILNDAGEMSIKCCFCNCVLKIGHRNRSDFSNWENHLNTDVHTDPEKVIERVYEAWTTVGKAKETQYFSRDGNDISCSRCSVRFSKDA